jgi:hypothetical protein
VSGTLYPGFFLEGKEGEPSLQPFPWGRGRKTPHSGFLNLFTPALFGRVSEPGFYIAGSRKEETTCHPSPRPKEKCADAREFSS